MEKSTADVITCKPPSTSTFSFKAPFPAASSSSGCLPLKQRRVSLALPSSPRLVPAWSFRDDTGLDSHIAGTSELTPERKGKMRKIDLDQDTSDAMSEKRQRKKWTAEETQMLVDGCNTWGVGNWKAILKDPSLKFDNRSPVDLKDRFRTYFPDAYKQHYPNAKTHLSSKIRSTLPDGRSIFEKTRSKKRRPFTDEEDRALKAGYEKHGTVWATIVKDPVFQEQNRRSTDLRDRFRNAFPDLYQAAGYKPRNGPKAKRKKEDGTWIPTRAATDDQIIPTTTSGPVRRRRAQTTQGYLRGGTKSVPESTTCSEDEDSSAEEEEDKAFKKPAPVAPASFVVAGSSTPQPEDSIPSTEALNEMDMYTIDQLPEPLSIPDYLPSSSQSMSEMTDSSQLQSWAHIDSSIHSSTWSSANTAGSPTSSHISDYFLTQSPFNRRSNGMDTIGKSAWGTQDWFSPNPRLDPSEVSSSSSSFAGGLSPAPSSPFSFQNLNHGVMDRYDLFPTTMPHDFASEVGMGDTHSTFSDPEIFAPSSFRGFTHHSNYAGDLIFGARSHQTQQPSYGSGFGFGTPGLGLQGMQQSAGIHPMQLHTSALPGIDEIELASINLNDHAEQSHHREMMGSTVDTGIQKDDDEIQLYNLDSQSLDDVVDLSQELRITPPATPLTSLRSHRQMTTSQHPSSSHSRSYSVPPGEFRSNASRPPQIHTNSQPHMARPLPQSDLALPHQHQSSMSESSFLDQGGMPPSSYHDSWRLLSQPNNDYDLPFLDLHYYGGHANGPSYDDAEYQQESEHTRQGQALDLAQSSSIKTPSSSPPIGPSSPHITHTFVDTSRVHHTHQRRQSALSPQDLLTRKGSENKRKRASWDGGVS